MARMPRLILLLTSILLLSLSVGCSSNAVVTLKPIPGNSALTATFTRTCYQKDQSGQDEIVLESDPINEPIDTAPGQPINAVTTPPLWQVLVIQLHWRTSLAGSPDSPVGDNAVMHWYIYGKPDRQGTASSSNTSAPARCRSPRTPPVQPSESTTLSCTAARSAGTSKTHWFTFA